MVLFDDDTRTKIVANKRNWDARTPIHVTSKFYGIGDRDPTSWFAPFEWHDLGRLDGREVLHLQCHLGVETMAFALKGAHTTGLDFSDVSLQEARRVARQAELAIDYVHADVYDAVKALGAERFDPGLVRDVDIHQKMFDMIFGYRASQTIRAFADLSLADHLADGPLTAAEAAAREGSAPETTFRLMRAGIALGLLTVDAEQRFHSTALLDTLREGVPASLRGLALGVTNHASWLPWSEFVETVRTGRSQADKALGMEIFEYLRQHPAQSQELTAAMKSVTSLWALDVAHAIDTSDVQLAVDVGGASGALLRGLQQVNPGLHGIVFDRLDVASDVADAIASSEFADRTEVVGGDFFQAVPPADLYLLKSVLHDWDDASCVQILSRCTEAMILGGRVVIIEFLLKDLEDPGVMTLTDLSMLTLAGGQERSLAEFDALLSKAGLRRTGVRTSDSPLSVVEAVVA